tara:strand:- start:510 stop:1676 length:1167 start_codon:yes stop_codon:yes gene_type:complete
MFLIGDVLRKTAIYFNLDFIRYTAVFKTIVIVTYVVFIGVFIKEYTNLRVTKKFIVFSAILLCFFFLGQISIKSDTSIVSLLSGNILFLSRYLFWFLTLIAFLPLISSNEYSNQHLRLFSIIFFVNFFFILYGFFFDINLFKTYLNSDRFGFMGIYNTSNQVSYYFILFILYYYYRVYFKAKNYLAFGLVFLVSLLVGTKKVYFFLIILFLYHFLKFKIYQNSKFYTILSAFVVLVIVFFSKLKAFFASKFQIFVNIYNEDGLISSVTSLRDKLLVKTFDEILIKSWRLPNYIFGGPKFQEVRTEFELIDLYLFFGFFGLYAFYCFFKTFYQFTHFSKFYLFILVSVGLTAFFSSGFLSDANQPILFILISWYFITETNQEIKEFKEY